MENKERPSPEQPEFFSHEERMASLQSRIILIHSEVAQMVRELNRSPEFQARSGYSKKRPLRDASERIRQKITVLEERARELQRLLGEFERGLMKRPKIHNVFVVPDVLSALQRTLRWAEAYVDIEEK